MRPPDYFCDKCQQQVWEISDDGFCGFCELEERLRHKEKIMTTLEEAKSLIYGDRNESYDHPAKNLKRTAEIWTAILRADGTLQESAWVNEQQVALMMIGLKIAREGFKHSRDNLVDMAGYVGCLERILYGDSEGLNEHNGNEGV